MTTQDGTTAAAASSTDASAAATTTDAQASAAVATSTEQATTGADTSKPADAASTADAKSADGTQTDASKVAPKEGDAAKDGDAEPTGAPEKYEAFELPEGMSFAPETVEKLTTVAKELNLPQASAQKLASLGVDFKKTWDAEVNAKITEVRNGWETSSKSDKQFGGDNFEVNLAISKQAVNTFGSAEFKQLLIDSGVGNHPEFIRTFLNIGKAISPDVLVGSADASGSGNLPQATGFAMAASKLYGGTKT